MPNNIIDSGLRYEPPPVVSESFTKAFNEIVPLSPNGVDRQIRYVWGCDRLEYCAGYWERRYGDVFHDPAEYVGRCQWILEGWTSPDVFDRAEWKADEHLLGEWPASGVWDFIEYHMDADHNYLPLDESALERVRNWKYWQGLPWKRSVDMALESKHKLWTRRQKERAAAADKVSTRFGEEVVKLFENEKAAVHSLPSKTGGFKETASGILVPA